MDLSSPFPSSASVAPPPIPRKSRERDRDRLRDPDRSPDRRTPRDPSKPKGDRAAAPADDDVFADWAAYTNRERKREASADRRPHTRDDDPPSPVPPASPEVISSLITSLSAISRPVSNHFDGPSYLSPASLAPPSGLQSPLSLSVPSSPTGGSFGVEYGAYNQKSLAQLPEEDVPLDELPASPPVIRTSKPPSGLSPLTAPRSPRSPGGRSSGFGGLLSRRSSGGVSRPSSRGSFTSGAESIGKPSIERGLEPLSPGPDATHSLKKQPSLDAWPKKGAGRPRGLMYMSSKERLRDKEEKKRASGGALGTSGPTTPRLDPLAAESVIDEEPNSDFILSVSPAITGPDGSGDTLADPRLIPARDSSLRKSNARRSSRRTSRNSKRDSDYGAIPELDEQTNGARASRSDSTTRRRHSGQKKSHGLDPLQLSANLPADTSLKPLSGPSTPAAAMFPDDIDDGAPSPAVAQSRRRDREASADYRRRSGRFTPDPFGGYVSEGGGTSVKLKRSSTKMKRLSSTGGALSDSGADRPRSSGTRKSSDHPHVAYERPQSADSIDDAVESYLCSPRLSQKIRHPQTGRVISFSEVGDPNGSAVFCCVGMGLTRYITAFYDELALTLKLRLITPDRPGVGDSEPYPDGTTTPLSWPDDVYAICQALKITKFSILAHSAGAIYALATALRMPQHIRGRIHLLAPWIPPSQMNVFGASDKTPLPPTNAIPTSQRILRALPTPILKAANSSFMTATSSSITSSLPKQKRVKRDKRSANKDNKDQPKGMFHAALEDKENQNSNSAYPTIPAADEDMDRIRPEANGASSTGPAPSSHGGIGHRHRRSNSTHTGYRRQSDVMSTTGILAHQREADRERQELYDNRLTHAIWQLATTGANPAVDLLVCLERRHTIGFRYVDITRPVVIHHGSRDTRVPVDNVRWLGKTMRRCEVRVLEGEGHGLMASAQVMGNVLMEISKEWEEWSRVTGATKRESERARRNTLSQQQQMHAH